MIKVEKQKGSTEVFSKFKSPETRQVQERFVSTLEHMQNTKELMHCHCGTNNRAPRWTSPEVEQDQVSGGVSVLCWHAAPIAYEKCTMFTRGRWNSPVVLFLNSIEKNSVDRFSNLTDNQIVHMISNHFRVLLDIFRLHQTNIDSIFDLNKTINS